jgi:chromosome partitioning protein
MELLGLAEVAQLLGVTKQVVANWKVRREGFPKPVVELKSGPVWRKKEVVAWAEYEQIETCDNSEKEAPSKEAEQSQRYAIIAAFMNMKGGVGKSTITANAGWWAAFKKDLRVLMIDLDPQFNLSQYVMGQRGYEELLEEQRPTIAALFDPAKSGGNLSLKDLIHCEREWDDGSCIHIVPASLDLAWSMRYAVDRSHVLRDRLEEVRSDYDLILIDCAPTESVLSTAAYLAATYIFVPVRPEFLSTIGLPLLLRSLKEFESTYTTEEAPQIGGIIFNDSGSKSEHGRSRQFVRDIAQQNGWYVFKSELSHSDSYPSGARIGRPIFLTDKARHWRKEELNELAKEFMGRIGI